MQLKTERLGVLEAITLASCALLCASAPTMAATLSVPSQYGTIQAALDAANDCDEIIVADGIYTGAGNVNLVIPKSVYLHSASGDPTLCIIDAQGVSGTRCIAEIDVCDNDCVTEIRGFTLTGGNAAGQGGAIYANITEPALVQFTDCVISNNTAANGGGGAYLDGASSCSACGDTADPCVNVTFDGCEFILNSAGASQDGGGLYARRGRAIVKNTLFDQNTARSGAGIYMGAQDMDLRVVNNEFLANTAGSNGGGLWLQGPTAVNNNLFAGNTAAKGGGVYLNQFLNGGTVIDVVNCTVTANLGGGGIYFDQQFNSANILNVSNCIVWSNAGGEVVDNSSGGTLNENSTTKSDPSFADPGSSDYRLSAGSTCCIDTGNDSLIAADGADLDGDGNTTEATPYDLDGNERVLDGNGDTLAFVDRGAYEFAGASATGACCAADGTCTVETESDCLAANGTYEGNGTDCDPNPCSPQDSDGDGVPDTVDVCNNTPPGVAVDAEGRPLGDLDHDCDTDMVDFELFQNGFTGPLP